MKKRKFTILAIAALLIIGTVSVVSAISMDNAADAEDAALAHAGVNEAQWVHSEYDVDDGVPQWEVDFYADGWEYEYEIHAETGTVLKHNKEYEGSKKTAPTETTPAALPEVPAATLTAAEAEALALTHAQLTADQVTRLHSKYDLDDGVPHWEVDFRADSWEYEYEIHAETGTVLKHNKEYEGSKKTAPTETTPAALPEVPAATLTAAEAEALALTHAQLTADQVTRLRSEYDLDDGVPHWEVDFYANGWEYEYEIHAETGTVLHSEMDRDD